MRIENPQSKKELDIYSARLKFTKEKNGQVSKNIVRVVIRYKKRDPKKRDLPIPKDIDTRDLAWKRYRGEDIAIYHREGDSKNYDYIPFNKGGIRIPAALRHRLEGLVKKVCFENSDKTEHTK